MYYCGILGGTIFVDFVIFSSVLIRNSFVYHKYNYWPYKLIKTDDKIKLICQRYNLIGEKDLGNWKTLMIF